MRNLFSPAPGAPVAPVTPPVVGGWNGLSSKTKLTIGGIAAAGIILVVVWPSAGPQQAPPPPTEAHPPAAMSDFQPPAPPPVAEAAKPNTAPPPPPARPAPRYRPVPTEMALYRLPANAANSAAQPAAAPATAPTRPDTATESGLPPVGKAVLVKHPDFLIRAGEVIPCNPVGHQNSEKQGTETCQTPTWFRSTNLRRGLMPPHTRLVGHLQAGMQAGEQRLGIIYTLIETPWFSVPINAPAGDPLGAAGLDKVDVNTFFWDRAGAVALYALMDGTINFGQSLASQALQRAFSGNGNNNYGPSFNFNSGSQSQSLAAKEFEATINRPPVGTRAPALPVTVTVGQDLDFYDACLQALRIDPMACPLQ